MSDQRAADLGQANDRQATVSGAVEQVAAPKMISQIRDVPRSCICSWAWGAPLYRWVMLSRVPGCPWHRDAQ